MIKKISILLRNSNFIINKVKPIWILLFAVNFILAGWDVKVDAVLLLLVCQNSHTIFGVSNDVDFLPDFVDLRQYAILPVKFNFLNARVLDLQLDHSE